MEVAIVVLPGGAAVLADGDRAWCVDDLRAVGDLDARLVWWQAPPELVAAGLRVRACWDIAAVTRLVAGGRRDDPASAWATAAGLPLDGIPRTGQLDLLGAPVDAGGDESDPIGPDGYLRPGWQVGDDRARAGRWARLALEVQRRQVAALERLPDRRALRPGPPLPLHTAYAESAAALLAVELAHDGLPVDVPGAIRQLTGIIGERPADAAAETAVRADRDATVLALLPDGVRCDLRNPVQVRDALRRMGFDVPDTRSWRLEPFRESSPVIAALLDWRRRERIATTYGYGWLDECVGGDGRLRGPWSASDGGAGRMTAGAGLHNMPVELRAMVAAGEGQAFVRADLGQIEPRVLAAVSGDRALAAATASDDLYLPVAAAIGCDRPTAKVAVLAAMYGQTSGTAGMALRRMQRAYPDALAFLEAADAAGRRGEPVRTWGGRLVPMGGSPDDAPGVVAGRGRYARNAVVQGAAAELFKAWAATVRASLAPLGARIVLCLHDELLVHVPTAAAAEAATLVTTSLDSASARWAAGSAVRFVADVSIVQRWSEAKA